MHGFLAFIAGGTDATSRACANEWCESSTSGDGADVASGDGADVASGDGADALSGDGADAPSGDGAGAASGPPSLAQGPMTPGNDNAAGMDPGLASMLSRGDSVVVRGLRQMDGQPFGPLPAVVLRARSAREADFLAVEIKFPSGLCEERLVPVGAVDIPPGRGRKRLLEGEKETLVRPELADREEDEVPEIPTEDTCPDTSESVPSVKQIQGAKVALLQDWSAANGLVTSLRRPLLMLNLCALWHPEALSTLVTQLNNLERYEEQVQAITAGQLIRSPGGVPSSEAGGPSSQCSPTKGVTGHQSTSGVLSPKVGRLGKVRKDLIEKLRHRYAGEQCAEGNLCRQYRSEFTIAMERLEGLRRSEMPQEGDACDNMKATQYEGVVDDDCEVAGSLFRVLQLGIEEKGGPLIHTTQLRDDIVNHMEANYRLCNVSQLEARCYITYLRRL